MAKKKTPDVAPTSDVPEGMMRVWDADQKTVVLVPEPPGGNDLLALTIRLHDPKERNDASLSTSWAVIRIPREDLTLDEATFVQKHIVPAIRQLKQLKLT